MSILSPGNQFEERVLLWVLCWRRPKIGIEQFAYSTTQNTNWSCICCCGCWRLSGGFPFTYGQTSKGGRDTSAGPLGPGRYQHPRLNQKGFFFKKIPCHYNFQGLEIHRWNSTNLKHAITIFDLPHPCHFLHLPHRWAHLLGPVFSLEHVLQWAHMLADG